jgi:hypothetical protein
MITSGQHGIGRREFLKSAGCAVATAAVGPQMLAAVAGKPKSIVAGFAPLTVDTAGSDQFEFNVSAADRVRGADGEFIRHDAIIRVAGVSGARSLQERRSREFVTHFSVTDGPETSLVPFTAWRCGRVFECNTPVSFRVPLNEDQKILFSVLGESSSSPEENAMPVELTLRNGGTGVALNRGYYIIVPLYDKQRAPDWSLLSLRRTNGRWALYELAFGEIRLVAFEHFVVRVDYAPALQ